MSYTTKRESTSFWDDGATVITELIGQTVDKATQSGDTLTFEIGDQTVTFLHEQDCCETVIIQQIDGDLEDLVGSPLTMAEVVTESGTGDPPNAKYDWGEYTPDSWTWTFCKFATVRGYVTVRWIGESNGYYSEIVTMVKES